MATIAGVSINAVPAVAELHVYILRLQGTQELEDRMGTAVRPGVATLIYRKHTQRQLYVGDAGETAAKILEADYTRRGIAMEQPAASRLAMSWHCFDASAVEIIVGAGQEKKMSRRHAAGRIDAMKPDRHSGSFPHSSAATTSIFHLAMKVG